MRRFDDELRQAAEPLAKEPLPPEILDEALDHPPSWPGWLVGIGAVAGMLIVAVAVGLGIGQLTAEPGPGPTSDASPTGEPIVACENLAPPAGGADVVTVTFPCGSGMATGVRSVAFDLSPVERLEAAVRAVLDGPSDLETSAGFQPVVPSGSSDLLASVELADDGLATIGFTEDLLRVNNLSASAASGAFLGSLRETAFQFEEVTAILFTADASCERFFEFFQGACDHVARPLDGTLGDCAVIPPAELPSGAPLTAPRPYPGHPIVVWGHGDDTVRQRAEAGRAPMPDGATPVEVRGHPGWVAPTGDEPLPLPLDIAWVEDGCSYAVTVALRGGREEALDYAARIGPAVATPTPSPPPGEPVTVSVEEQGIRLTVTLDRDRTVFGQRVVATAVVENLGAGPVFWGHSSTCPFPVYVDVAADDAEPLEYGRTDWTGDDAILKNVTVDDTPIARAGRFGFRPESWLDAEGLMGCTSDFVISELEEGGSLTDVVAWDTVAQHGMPPPPGAYTVEAVFSFESRGAPPAFGDEPDDRLTVRLTMPLIVDGPGVAYLSPGEAFDAVLADPGYRDLLADAPRERWVRSDLAFEDGRWVAALYLSASSREVDPVEAIVATVDARSGEVLSVALEEGRVPPGG